MPTQISAQEIEIVNALRRARRQWLSARDVQARTPNTAARTVRAVLLKLAREGVADYVEVFPGRRYRLAADAEEKHAAYFLKVSTAAAALGCDVRGVATSTYFHTTDAAEAILREGFRDGEGGYMFASLTLRGVFLADMPVGVNEGAKGEDVLAVTLPSGLDLADYELVQEGSTYREWCVPAALLNTHGTLRLLSGEEEEELARRRWLA
ncbi:hypothetical protein ABT300_05585 [Streptomyces sp. NPDC001027]|uniref:hypothetical protein n=1 Tax=Streptomyces sp. NPDC001027 TaxID=3154771 RepID=UPI003317CAEA